MPNIHNEIANMPIILIMAEFSANRAFKGPSSSLKWSIVLKALRFLFYCCCKDTNKFENPKLFRIFLHSINSDKLLSVFLIAAIGTILFQSFHV